MKLQYLTAIFVVLFPLAKAAGLRDYFNRNWLKIADDACKNTCGQTDALFSPSDNRLLSGVKICTVQCSCNKEVKLPDDTSCDYGPKGFEVPGKCSSGSCNEQPAT